MIEQKSESWSSGLWKAQAPVSHSASIRGYFQPEDSWTLYPKSPQTSPSCPGKAPTHSLSSHLLPACQVPGGMQKPEKDTESHRTGRHRTHHPNQLPSQNFPVFNVTCSAFPMCFYWEMELGFQVALLKTHPFPSSSS